MGSGNEDNEWYINYKVGYLGTKVSSHSWKGELEYVVGVNGSAGYKMIAEAEFDNTAKVGFSRGTTLETTTAASDYSKVYTEVGSSKGRDLVTC